MLFLDLLFGGSPPALEALKHIETPRKAYYYAGPGRHYVCGAPLATFVFKGQFWLVVWNIFYFSIQFGMSSSQLTSSLHHFSEG